MRFAIPGTAPGSTVMTLPAYERLGVFYLGRESDPATQQPGNDLLYDSRDLTTHAICIGMTGSGKTGLRKSKWKIEVAIKLAED